jgi:hypothetical protein
MKSTEDLVGEIVTVRTIVGEELMGKLEGLASNKTILELHGLRVVTLDPDGQIMMLPYTLTGQDEVIGLPTRHVLSIVQSTPEASEGFQEDLDETPNQAEGPADLGEDSFSL